MTICYYLPRGCVCTSEVLLEWCTLLKNGDLGVLSLQREFRTWNVSVLVGFYHLSLCIWPQKKKKKTLARKNKLKKHF